MAYYNPYKDDKQNKKDPSEDWFLRAGISAALLGANAFAIYGLHNKAKGPFMAAMEKIANRQSKKIIRKEYIKTQDHFDFEEGTQRLRDKGLFTADLDISDDDISKLSLPSAGAHNRIKELEATIGDFKDIGSVADLALAKVRFDSIKEYIKTKTPEGAEIIAQQLDAYESNLAGNSGLIKAIHERFLAESGIYCSDYKTNLGRFYGVHFKDHAGNLKPDAKSIRDSIDKHIHSYYSSFFWATQNEDVRPKGLQLGLEFKDIPTIGAQYNRIGDPIDLRKIDLLNGPKRFLASSGRIRPHGEMWKLPLEISYDSNFRDLRSALDSAMGRPDSPIANYNFVVETRSKPSGKRNKGNPNTSSVAILEIIPKEGTGGEVVRAEIPMTMDLRMPGATVSSVEHLDHLFVLGDNFGATPELAKYYNGTQLMIHKIIKIINSPTLVNELKKDSSGNLQYQLDRMISGVQWQLSQVTGELRDTAIKGLSVQSPWVEFLFDGPHARKQVAMNTSSSLKLLKNLNGKNNAVVISIDFEALCPNNIGVDKTPYDVDTHLYKAGFQAMDYRTGKVLDIPKPEMVSDFALKKLSRKITPTTEKMLAGWLGVDQDKAWDIFSSQIENDSKNPALKIDAEDNVGFMRAVVQKLKQIQEQFQRQNKDVYFEFKNGWQYDINFFKNFGGMDWLTDNKEKIIDVQNIANIRAIGSASTTSLSMENMLETTLRTVHGSEDTALINYLSSNKKDVKALISLLTRSGKGAYAGRSLINMSKAQISGFDGMMHLSPKTDALMALALLRFEHFDYLNKTGMYKDLDKIISTLDIAAQPVNAFTFIELLKATHATTLKGYSVGMSAVGKIDNRFVGSLLSLPDLIGFGDVGWAKRSDQVYRGLPLTASTKNYQMHRKEGRSKWEELRKFSGPSNSTYIMDAEHILKAEGNANVRSHLLTAQTAFLFSNPFGQQNFHAYNSDFIYGVKSQISETIHLPISMMNDNTVMASKAREFHYEVVSKVTEVARKQGLDIKDPKVWDIANRTVAEDPRFDNLTKIRPGTHNINGTIKHIQGKIARVDVDPNTPGLVVKILRTIEGKEWTRNPVVATSGTSRSLATFSKQLSIAMGHGSHGFDAMSKFDALDKGFVGWYKIATMDTVLRKWQDTYHSTNNVGEKARARANIERLAGILQGTVMEDEGKVGHLKVRYGEYTNRTKRFFNNLDEGKSNIAHLYTGGFDLTLKKIHAEMVEAGLVHTEQSARDWNTHMGQKQMQLSYLKEVEVMKKQLLDGKIDKKYDPFGALANLNTEGRVNLVSEMDELVSNFGTVTPGSAKVFEMFPLTSSDGGTFYVPGAKRVAQTGLSNVHDGSRATNSKVTLQRGYFLDILHNMDSKHSIHRWATESVACKSMLKYAKAYKSYSAVRDMIKSKMVINGITLKEMEFLLPPSSYYDSKEAKRLAVENKYTVGGAQQTIFAAMQDEALSDIDKLGIVEEDISVLSGMTDKAERVEDPLKVRRFSTKDIGGIQSRIRKLSTSNNGIVSLALKTAQADAVVIPLYKTIQHMGNKLGKNYTMSDTSTIADSMVSALLSQQEKAKHSWYTLTKTPDDMELTLTHIPLLLAKEADENFKLMAEAGDGVTMSREALMTTRMVQALDRYGKATAEHIEPSKEFLHQRLITHLSSMIEFDKNSKGFEMQQSLVDGTWAYHSNVDTIAAIAVQMGSPSDEYLRKNGIKDGGRFRTIREKLLKSRQDTMFMTQSLFTQYIQGQAGDNFSSLKAFGDQYKHLNLDKVLAGEDMLYGGLFSRFPIAQNGIAGALSTKIQVVDDEYAELLGMNNDTFYAHSLYSKHQGADVDGDRLPLMLRLNSMLTKKDYQKLKFEQRQDYRRYLNQLDVSIDMKRYRQHDMSEKLRISDEMSLYGFKDGKALVSTTDEGGRLRIVSKDIENVDFIDMFHKTVALTTKAEAERPRNLTKKHIENIEVTEYQLGLMKNTIGQATNAGRVRAMSMIRSNLSGREGFSLPSTLTTGISGLSQAIIDSAKHAESAEQANKTINFLLDPKTYATNENEARAFWLDMGRKAIGDEDWNLEIGKTGTTIGEMEEIHFDMMTGKQSAMLEVERLNPELRIARESHEKIVLGSRNASLWDYMITMQNGLPPEVGDAMGNKNGSFITPEFDFGDFGNRIKKKLTGSRGIFRKGSTGKFAALGAVAFLGLNLFRPNQLSNSMNPLDAFVSLDQNIDGSQNMLSSDIELDRRIPLDTVNASFSRAAYVKLNTTLGGQDNKIKSDVLQNMVSNAFAQMGQHIMSVTDSPQVNYANYTTFVGNFGTSSIRSRSRR